MFGKGRGGAGVQRGDAVEVVWGGPEFAAAASSMRVCACVCLSE